MFHIFFNIFQCLFDFSVYSISQFGYVSISVINISEFKLFKFYKLSKLFYSSYCKKITNEIRFISSYVIADRSAISGPYLLLLMSLPNLEVLEIDANKIPQLTKRAEKLKKLVTYSHSLDWNNLAKALVFMPLLSSLTLNSYYGRMTKRSARTIKEAIHSRGQNIVLNVKQDAFLKQSLKSRVTHLAKKKNSRFSLAHSILRT